MKLLDFYTDWCSQCKAQEKILTKITKVPVEKINVDTEEGEPWVDRLEIRNLPVLALVDNNNMVLGVKRGLTQLNEINNWIDSF